MPPLTKQNLAYKNPKLPPEKRVRDLLARMTLAEKAAQMMCVWQEKSTKLVDADGSHAMIPPDSVPECAQRQRSRSPSIRNGAC